MSEITNLDPRPVWEIFDSITKVPRPSKKEEKIIAYLEDFARAHDLDYRKDGIGNIVICRPASPSMKSRPTVILQSHMDMVCEKNSGVEFDFDNDSIQPYITEDGKWVKAKGTTLGADDGIGMAAALALLIDDTLELPAIEALFTVDEETGLTGAFELGPDMITGKYLINLDSEDEGEIFIGCAGGIDTVATFRYKKETAPSNHTFFRIDVAGLKGGHSGDDINKGLGNSNKILTRFLWQVAKNFGLCLSTFDGGNLRNAIPREAHAVFCVPVNSVKDMFELFEKFVCEINEELHLNEPDIDISISEVPPEKYVIDTESRFKLLMCLQGLPNGVLAMSAAMPGMVETSTNLASVKFNDRREIIVTTSQRSSIDGARYDAAAAIESVFELAGAEVVHSEGYPGWNPNPSSRLLSVTRESYKRLFGVEPVVRAIHAGLECGLFLQKYPDLEMVSFGPTLRGVHSPDERLEIETVGKFWDHLVDTLRNI